MFRGAGKIGLKTRADNHIMYAPRVQQFRLTNESTEETAKGFPQGTCGPRVTVDKETLENTYKIFLSIESFDAEDMGFIVGERPEVATNFTFPEMVSIAVPTTRTYAETGLITDQKVAATVLDSTHTYRVLEQVPSATGTLPVGTFSVGAGAITFNAGEVGKFVNFTYDKIFTTSKTLGVVQNPRYWSDVSFSGLVCGSRFSKPMRIYVPSMKASQSFDFSIGDKTTIEIEFELALVGNDRIPFKIADL